MSYYGPPPHPPYPQPGPPPRYYDQSRGPDNRFAPELDTPKCAPAGCMRRGEQVEVRVRGNVWIVGFLVSSLHLLSSYLGQGYEVEYTDLRSGQALRAGFPTEDVRPFPR